MAHLFCPKSGHLLKISEDNNVIECEESGYQCALKGTAPLPVHPV